MYEPYTDNPTTSGLFVTPLKELRRYIPKYLDAGWQVVSRVVTAPFSPFIVPAERPLHR
jgi:hypothetical protein